MAKSHYLPHGDKDRTVWLNNFVNKFASVATGLGFTAGEVTSVTNDAAMFQYLVNQVEAYTTAKELRVNYKNLIKDGPLGKAGGPLPVAPAAGTPPAVVAPGIFPRIAQLVQRIKNSANYTEAMGRDLGIIGAEQILDLNTMKPAIKLVMKGGLVEVQWARNGADSIFIESDKGNGWQFLAIDSVPHYPDTTKISTPGIWKYRAYYIIDDERVGEWSDVVNITVGGQ